MRVTGVIAVLVMSAIYGDPLKQGPLNAHGPENRKYELHQAICLEGTVCKEAMETDRDSDGSE